MSPHFVTKLHHTALVGFDLRQMEGDVSVELLEEWDPIADQDRQDRIANFVVFFRGGWTRGEGQSETGGLSRESPACEPGRLPRIDRLHLVLVCCLELRSRHLRDLVRV